MKDNIHRILAATATAWGVSVSAAPAVLHTSGPGSSHSLQAVQHAKAGVARSVRPRNEHPGEAGRGSPRPRG